MDQLEEPLEARMDAEEEEEEDDQQGSETDNNPGTSNGPSQEVLATEKVVNAFFFYNRYCREKVFETITSIKQLSEEHQQLISPTHSAHIKTVLQLIEKNQEVLKLMVLYSADVLGEDLQAALRIHQPRAPTSGYMSKVMSTIRQIVREWTAEGKEERDSTYGPIINELRHAFPNEENRANIKIMVPGSGLGRLAWDIICEGFTVQGNEYSMFMLCVSCFLLNACSQVEQLTIYPYIMEKSNSWSYADQTRAVKFPDCCPGSSVSRANTFSMCAGGFLDITIETDSEWDVIVTSWFIDTANNIIDYIERFEQILKPGGLWINVGPLTYHFENIAGEISIELPYDEVIRIARSKGFEILKEERISSRYTANTQSMLYHNFDCAFFVAMKSDRIPDINVPPTE